MPAIDTSEDNFKVSPLGYLMSVLAKYNAFVDRSLSGKPDKELEEKNNKARDVLSNIKIELAQNSTLKNEVSNEAVMMAVIESFPKAEQETVLEVIFDYLEILDEVLETADKTTEEGKSLTAEYYDVSRLGLILNCYLGQFDNDDFFYGSLAYVLESMTAYYTENKEGQAEKIITLSSQLISKIEKADIDLSFEKFLTETFEAFDSETKEIFYKNIIRPFADSLLEKIITQAPEEDDAGRLACVKQIQRIVEKLICL